MAKRAEKRQKSFKEWNKLNSGVLLFDVSGLN